MNLTKIFHRGPATIDLDAGALLEKDNRGTRAQKFLDEHPVDRKLFCIVVETPEGNYGRDIEGM